jgi:hypothetical protein
VTDTSSGSRCARPFHRPPKEQPRRGPPPVPADDEQREYDEDAEPEEDGEQRLVRQLRVLDRPVAAHTGALQELEPGGQDGEHGPEAEAGQCDEQPGAAATVERAEIPREHQGPRESPALRTGSVHEARADRHVEGDRREQHVARPARQQPHADQEEKEDDDRREKVGAR